LVRHITGRTTGNKKGQAEGEVNKARHRAAEEAKFLVGRGGNPRKEEWPFDPARRGRGTTRLKKGKKGSKEVEKAKKSEEPDWIESNRNEGRWS